MISAPLRPSISKPNDIRPTKRWPLPHILLLVLAPITIYAPEWLGLVSADPLHLPWATRTQGLLPGTPGWIDYCAGVIVEALGRRVADDWFHAIIPWWNPYSGVGMPMAGEYQPAVFFLPFILLMKADNGLLMMKCSLQIVAGLSTYALLRALRLDPRAALAGALLYAFNGTFAWASDGPSQPLAFLPLALYGVERARTGSWGWLTLGLAYLLLAGFPETAFLLGTLVLGWAILRFATWTQNRVKFAARIMIGGIAALLIASPQLLAFATFLPHAYIGSHAATVDSPLPPSCWAMLLLPYVNGTFFYGAQYTPWFALGGYTGLVLPFLALISLGGQRERGLRFLLFGFAVAIIGKQANLPIITPLVDLIPGVGRTVFYRLAMPVLEAALIYLAALALDDLYRGDRGMRRIIAALLALSALTSMAWHWDAAMRHALIAVSEGRVTTKEYIYVSALFAFVTLTSTIIMLIRRAPTNMIACCVVVEALALFTLPLFSAQPAQNLDTTMVTRLAKDVGIQRFISLGPIEPNYGAYDGIASINHNAIPTPMAWIDFLRSHLGQRFDPVTFNGTFPQNPDDTAFLEPFIARDPEWFSQLGVSDIVVPHGAPPPGVTPYPLVGGHADGVTLSPSSPEATFDIAAWQIPEATHMSFRIGTFFGQSDGALIVEACDSQRCSHGQATVLGALDNGYLSVSFDHPTPINATSLRLRLTNAQHPLMIWAWRNGIHLWPVVHIQPVTSVGALIPVLSSPAGDIYRLPTFAPYFETTPACKMTVIDRENLKTECVTPARLIRRELMLPGWTANINGRSIEPETVASLFEAVDIPAGDSTIRFHFEPPGTSAAWIGAAIGLALLLAGFRRGPGWTRRWGLKDKPV